MRRPRAGVSIYGGPLPDVKISAQTPAPGVLGSMVLPVAAAGNSFAATIAQLRNFIYDVQTLTNAANFAFPNDANPNPVFASVLNLTPGVYYFQGLICITGMGATTRTTATLFGGTAVISSIRYYAMIQTGAANALGTTQSTKSCVTATANVLNATVTTAAEAINFLQGKVVIGTGGTFFPQVQHSANPTGTIVVGADSFFRVWT